MPKWRTLSFWMMPIKMTPFGPAQKRGEGTIAGRSTDIYEIRGKYEEANVEEALAGQSKKDFIARMSIASKEARETNYWLRLLQDSKLIPEEKIRTLIDESEEIIRILTSIVKTSMKGLKTKN